MNTRNNVQIAMRVSGMSIVINTLLFSFKLIAGIIGKSSAMVSDAVHSASDVFSTLIVMVGVKLSGKASDKGHPYGHERMECVAAIILAILLCATGLGIGYAGAMKIISSEYENLAIPSLLPLIAAVVSIVVKEAMYWYTRWAAKKTNSGALMADAWHHRSDALSSVGSFIGIFGARMGLPVLDPIASIIICLFIIAAALNIFKDSIGKMTDQACGQDMVDKIMKLAEEQNEVLGIDQLKTRLFGSKIYVDIEICIDGNVTLEHAHHIAHKVHDEIEGNIEDIKHCMVHVNPK